MPADRLHAAQGDEGTLLDEIFRKAEIDLPQQFRTIDYMRDRSRFEGAMRNARFTEGAPRVNVPRPSGKAGLVGVEGLEPCVTLVG